MSAVKLKGIIQIIIPAQCLAYVPTQVEFDR